MPVTRELINQVVSLEAQGYKPDEIITAIKESTNPAYKDVVEQIDFHTKQGHDSATLLDSIKTSPSLAEQRDNPVVSLIRQAGTGVKEGVLDIAGFPADVVANLAQTVGLQYPGGSKQLKDYLLGERPAPEGALENIARATGQQFGSASIPLGAGSYMRYAQKAPAAMEALLGPASASMKKLLGTQAAVSTGAGIGSGIAREAAPNSPWADVLAQLAGGGLTALPIAAAQKGKNLLHRFTREGMQQDVGQELSNIIEHAPVEFAQKTADAVNVQDAIPDIKFTLGQKTGLPTLIRRERALSKSEGWGEIMMAKQMQQNVLLTKYADEIVEGDITDFVNAVREGRATAQQVPNALARTTMSKQEAGKTLLDRLYATKKAKQDMKTKLYGEVSRINPSIDAPEIPQMVDQIMQPYYHGELASNFPTEHANMIKSYFKPPDESLTLGGQPIPPELASKLGLQLEKTDVSFNDLTGWISSIGEEIRKQQGLGKEANDNLIKRLTELKVMLQGNEKTPGVLSKLLAREDEVGEMYRAANSFYVDEYLPFKQRTAALLQQRGAHGESSKIAESELIGQYFSSKGGTEAAQNLKATLGNDTDAMRAVRDWLVNDIMSTATDGNGLVQAKPMVKWLKDRRDALKEFPELAKELGNIKGVQRNVDEMLKRTLFADGEITQVIPTILRSKNPSQEMKYLARIVGDDTKAMNGLRKEFWSYASAKADSVNKDIAGNPIPNPNKLQWVENKWPLVLESLYTPEQLKNMRIFHKGVEIMRRTEQAPGITKGSDTAELLASKNLAQLAEYVTSLIAAKSSSLPWFFAKGVGRNIYNMLTLAPMEVKQHMWNTAMVDPDVAEMFIRVAQGKVDKKVESGFSQFLFRSPVAVEATMSKSKEQQPSDWRPPQEGGE